MHRPPIPRRTAQGVGIRRRWRRASAQQPTAPPIPRRTAQGAGIRRRRRRASARRPGRRIRCRRRRGSARRPMEAVQRWRRRRPRGRCGGSREEEERTQGEGRERGSGGGRGAAVGGESAAGGAGSRSVETNGKERKEERENRRKRIDRKLLELRSPVDSASRMPMRVLCLRGRPDVAMSSGISRFVDRCFLLVVSSEFISLLIKNHFIFLSLLI